MVKWNKTGTFGESTINKIALTDTENVAWVCVTVFPDVADRRAYHTQQATLAESQKQHFAAVFHLKRLLLDEPDNAALKLRLDAATANLNTK